MIKIFHYDSDRQRIEDILNRLALRPINLALGRGELAGKIQTVQTVMADVAERGDAALVDIARKFDDPDFTVEQLRVRPEEMEAGAKRISAELMDALRRSISQVREYQTHIMPKAPDALRRGINPKFETRNPKQLQNPKSKIQNSPHPNPLPAYQERGRREVELGLRFTPIDSAGLLFPGGKAAYPSTLIMLAVPAQVAGVRRIAGFTPPSKFGKSDLVLAACHELGLTEIYRAGGPGAVAAMAFGTKTIQPVDKIVGPGNVLSQLAKRALAGCVGIDGFLGPSEILVLADDSANPAFVAADLMAQAEHDPGSCFLLTTSKKLADDVIEQMRRQIVNLKRADAIERGLLESSAIIVSDSMDELIELANRFAAEHVNLQVRDEESVLAKLKYGGAVFVGPYSPVAAGDYIAGPSHCLPTNTTARFTSGMSVYEFLIRSSIERYTPDGLAADAESIIALAEAEHLDAHANSVKVRLRG